jgi:hypothetical protein
MRWDEIISMFLLPFAVDFDITDDFNISLPYTSLSDFTNESELLFEVMYD